jgi:hypothetical protein
MAIDFADIDFIKDAADDIRKMTSRPEFYEKVVKEAAILHADSAEELTSQQRDPSGGPFAPLYEPYAEHKQKTVGNRRADMRYSGHAMDNMKIRQKGQNRGAEIYFTGRPSYSKENASEYMYKNQYGVGREERRIFPEARDASSAPQMEIHNDVYEILGKYLNQPRRINIVG